VTEGDSLLDAIYIYNTDPEFHDVFVRKGMEAKICYHIRDLKYLNYGEVEYLYNEVKKVFDDNSEL